MRDIYVPSVSKGINSLVCEKEGAQGEEEEEAVDRRKGEPTETAMPCVDAPTGLTRSGVSDARNRRKHEWWRGVPLYRKSKGSLGLALSSHDRNEWINRLNMIKHHLKMFNQKYLRII